MNVSLLRYIIHIENMGSINQAAKSLHISQASLSRILAHMEESLGFMIFRRGNKGITTTYEGKQFLTEAREILGKVEEFNSRYFQRQTAEAELLVTAQRCSVIVKAFIDYYSQYCQSLNFINIALVEEPCHDILEHVAAGIYNLGILHISSSNLDLLTKQCKNLMLRFELLDESRVCAQVGLNHPLAEFHEVSLDMLSDYTHITYSDEDITQINYCSDVLQYNQKAVNKRIIIQDRGSMLQIIENTDAYYLGCDWRGFKTSLTQNIKYIPLSDTEITIRTYSIRRNGYTLNKDESLFLNILKMEFAKLRF